MWWLEPYMAVVRLIVSISVWVASEDGMWPWVEHNQGAVSVAALGVALFGFWHENKRANHARAEAEETERRRKAELAEKEAEQRAFIEAERERQAEAFRRADIQRQLDHMQSFVFTALGLIVAVEQKIAEERQFAGGLTFHPSAATTTEAKIASFSLTAILPTAPMNARLLADVRKAAFNLERLSSTMPSSGATGEQTLTHFDDLMKADRMAIQEHNIELIARLAPAAH